MKEPIATPPGKILFLIGGILTSIFLLMYVVVNRREKTLGESFLSLQQDGVRTFSVLKEHHIKYKKGKRQDIYTYEIPDETGEKYEVSESVDPKTQNRLRVGDTVVCLRKVIVLSGKKLVISRIEGNEEPPANYSFLQNFSLFGLGFSIMLIFNSFFFWRKNES